MFGMTGCISGNRETGKLDSRCIPLYLLVACLGDGSIIPNGIPQNNLKI